MTSRICSPLPLLSRSIQTSINILNTTFCSSVNLFLTSPTDTISYVNVLGTYHLPRLDARERVHMTSFTTYCFTRSFFPCRPTRIQKSTLAGASQVVEYKFKAKRNCLIEKQNLVAHGTFSHVVDSEITFQKDLNIIQILSKFLI